MTVVYVLDGHKAVPCKNIIEWAQWYETGERQVMRTNLIDGSVISTVFLGVDHGWGGTPQLFETALISGESHYSEWLKRETHEIEVVARYATWGEAEAGHMDWIERCVPSEMIAATVKEQAP